MARLEHVVLTYREPTSLRAAVGPWIASALAAGRSALVACTPEHAEIVREELAQRGIDVETCEREGRLRLHDAEDLMRRFMIDGMPQRAAFKRLARELLHRVSSASGPGPVHIWGEMVDVLAKRGQIGAAHQLELLWNEILAENDARLLCSYELDALDPATHARVLHDVCATHSDLVPEEGPALNDAVSFALDDVFGPDDARLLRRVLPTRPRLLERMSMGSAILVSLRALHPTLGDQVARRARSRIADLMVTPARRAQK